MLGCGAEDRTTAERRPSPTSDPSTLRPELPTTTASVREPAPTSATTQAAPDTTAPAADPTTSLVDSGTETTSVPFDGALVNAPIAHDQPVKLRFESRVDDVTTEDLEGLALEILNDARGWPRAGFSFESDEGSPFVVILAEGDAVDELCLPLVTHGSASCQNGPVVALNATRWREGVTEWDAEISDYRGYLVNHEVGHLLGQRHPTPRCVIAGRPAAVMEPQSAGLEGCTGNAWPREWEIERAAQRPVVYAPLPDWGPEPIPANNER